MSDEPAHAPDEDRLLCSFLARSRHKAFLKPWNASQFRFTRTGSDKSSCAYLQSCFATDNPQRIRFMSGRWQTVCRQNPELATSETK
eukprot:5652176-Amphidinium_carterae.1